jgi:hypothetical protein
MTVARRLRYEVLRRDKHTCRYCGASAPDAKLTIDHVIPIALGGSDDPKNLVTACDDCNSGKTSSAPDQSVIDDVDDLALRYAAAMKQAHAIRTGEWAEAAKAAEEFKSAWDRWTLTGTTQGVPLDDDWAVSLERWLALGLTTDDLVRFVSTAMNSQAVLKDKWRYYCGCIWRELDTRRELAFKLMDGQPAPTAETFSQAPPTFDLDEWAEFEATEQDDMDLDGMYVESPVLGLDLPSEPFDTWIRRVSPFRACGICQAADPRAHCGRDNCFLPIGAKSGA